MWLKTVDQAPSSGRGCPGGWSGVQATLAMTAGTKTPSRRRSRPGDRGAIGFATRWSPPTMIGVRTRPSRRWIGTRTGHRADRTKRRPTGASTASMRAALRRRRRWRSRCSDEANDQQCRLVWSTVGGCVHTRFGSPSGRLPARRGRTRGGRGHAADEQPAAEHHWMADHWPCERCCEVRSALTSRPGATQFPSLGSQSKR